ncbi:unnamed protein product [Pleuronectes platessa]|uniref:Uncharacterized protein n=1 Tax=Pleuronectes platessa TaxID=8262 RepID=A0A9N7VWH1_PLEPL|nr:unnamed protein product [Pleuronectes platessa]
MTRVRMMVITSHDPASVRSSAPVRIPMLGAAMDRRAWRHAHAGCAIGTAFRKSYLHLLAFSARYLHHLDFVSSLPHAHHATTPVGRYNERPRPALRYPRVTMGRLRAISAIVPACSLSYIDVQCVGLIYVDFAFWFFTPGFIPNLHAAPPPPWNVLPSRPWATAGPPRRGPAWFITQRREDDPYTRPVVCSAVALHALARFPAHKALRTVLFHDSPYTSPTHPTPMSHPLATQHCPHPYDRPYPVSYPNDFVHARRQSWLPPAICTLCSAFLWLITPTPLADPERQSLGPQVWYTPFGQAFAHSDLSMVRFSAITHFWLAFCRDHAAPSLQLSLTSVSCKFVNSQPPCPFSHHWDRCWRFAGQSSVYLTLRLSSLPVFPASFCGPVVRFRSRPSVSATSPHLAESLRYFHAALTFTYYITPLPSTAVAPVVFYLFLILGYA